jgi:hypothetical protein
VFCAIVCAVCAEDGKRKSDQQKEYAAVFALVTSALRAFVAGNFAPQNLQIVNLFIIYTFEIC